jgi:hypothetical protein
MDTPTIINIGLSVGGVAITLVNGWILAAMKNVRDDIKGLREKDTAHEQALGAVRESVAGLTGKYITREEFNAALDRQTAVIVSVINGHKPKE